jgi:hypothetical protein
MQVQFLFNPFSFIKTVALRLEKQRSSNIDVSTRRIQSADRLFSSRT